MASEESYLRDQMEKAIKESKLHKQRVEQLEKENLALKKSVYDLSARLSIALNTTSRYAQGNGKIPPRPYYTIDQTEPTPMTADSEICSPSLMSPSVTANTENQITSPTSVVVAAPGTPQTSAIHVKTIGSIELDSLTSSAPTASTSYPSKKFFHFKYDLKGHTGAVYTVQFSPCGKFIASGSFDHTARIWDVMSTQSELMCLKKHSLNISDLAWSSDSLELMTGAYDNSVKLWSVETGKMNQSFETEGFVQCVGYCMQNSNYIFYGTSRKVLSMIDKRKPDAAIVIRNEAMVNALHVYHSGSMVMTGDSAGNLKTWDIRSPQQCIQSVLNDSSRKPISHITTCRQNADEEEPRYLAVNSYDNVLRVYDRGLDPPKSNMRLMHSLVGHKNKNWPIKSAFYQGPLVPRLKRDGQYGSEGLDELHDHHSHREFRGSASGNRRQIENRYLLLATGSADPYALVYSVGVTQSAASAGASVGQSGMTNWTASNTAIDDSTTDVDVNSPAGPLSPNASSVSDGLEHHQQQQFTSDIVQRIEGHADRVYAVSFHPTDILMATCSADSTIKVWKGKSSL